MSPWSLLSPGKALSAFGLLALVAAAPGCGPVAYVNQVTLRASSEVEAAKSAGADRTAIYEYTSAVEYLHKAREEAGYADYQAAIRFGRKSEQMARDAKRIALERAGGDAGADVAVPAAGSAGIAPAAAEETPPRQGEGG